MITSEQARELAERELNSGRPPAEREEIGVYEFDEGFVAWTVPPKRADPTEPPDEIGGSCIVINKDDGEVEIWPRLNPEGVAERYRRRRGDAAGG